MTAPSLHFHWALLDALKPAQLLEIVQTRIAVFVVEQHCAYQEVDAFDAAAHHLQARVGGELAAYARVLGPNTKYEQPSIGRVIVAQRFRAHQYGRALMQEAIAFTETTYPGTPIRLDAQSHLQGFYGSLGFVVDSEQYLEDGIPHVEMVRPSPALAQ